MTLEQLRILKHIVEYGSLKEAALRLHKTQPALSIAIKKLESEFGFQILDRSAYRLKLTPQGETFFREADILLNDSEHLTSLGKQLAQGNEALFRICFEHVCPIDLFIPAVKKAYQIFPATEFELRSGSRFSSLQDINDQKADLGIGPWFHLFNAQGEYDSFKIGEFELILAGTPELLVNQTDLSYEHLCQLPNLAISKSAFNFDSDKLTNFRGGRQLKVSDIPSLKSLLLQSAGWSITPRHLVEDELASGKLLEVNCVDKESNFTGELRVFRRSDTVPGPVSQYLWQTLKASATNNF